MARQKDFGLQKHTLNLRAGDIEALRQFIPDREPSVVLRQLLSRFVDSLRAKSSPPSDEKIDI